MKIVINQISGAMPLFIGLPVAADTVIGVPGTVTSTVQDGLAASGADLNSALQLSANINVFSTVAAGAGAKLPTTTNGNPVIVLNLGVNEVRIYPPNAGAKIGSSAAGAPVIVSPNQMVTFITKLPLSQWYAG